MRDPWGQVPFAALAVAFLLGIQSARLVHAYCFGLLAVSSCSFLAAAILAFRTDHRPAGLWLALSSIAVCGLMTAVARRDAFPDSDVRALLSRSSFPLGDPVLFDGCVVEESVQQGDGVSTTVALHGIQKQDRWIRCAGKGLLETPINPNESENLPGANLRSGDRVRGWAIWQVPRNYQNPGSADRVGFLARRGIFIMGRVKSARLLEVLPQDCGNPWANRLAAARTRLLKNLIRLDRSGDFQPAAILASLLIGDYSRLDNNTRAVFQNAGTYHVLVVSGLHVAWIAWVLVRLLRLLRCTLSVSRWLALLGICAYSCIVGFQASISRSLWMFILYLIGQTLLRRSSPANILFASAFLLLALRPDWSMDIGFQLSFLSVMAICLTALPAIDGGLKPLLDPLRHAGDSERIFAQTGPAHRWGRRLRVRCELAAEACADASRPASQTILLGGTRAAALVLISVGSSIVISASVQLWIEPLLAYSFNRLCWIAPFANLFVVPMSSAVLAAGAVAALTADIPGLGMLILEAAGRIAGVFLAVTHWVSELPGAWQRCPTPAVAWVLAGILALFSWSFFRWRRPWIPCLYVSVILAAVRSGSISERHGTLLSGENSSRKATFSLTFLDVGQGDSIVLRFPDKGIWVVDAGGIRQPPAEEAPESGFDFGEAVVSRYLWSFGTRQVDRLVLSHPDQDHAGGIPAVMKNFQILRLDYGETRVDPILDRILVLASGKKVPPYLVRSGEESDCAGVRVRVLNPPGDNPQWSTNENSVVLHLTYGRFSALLTGDLEKSGELQFVSRNPSLRSELLKVAHHGSRFSTTDRLLQQARPLWGVISVGRNNPFGHPSLDVLLRLQHHGTRPLLTRDRGAITLETDGNQYAICSFTAGILERGVLPQNP